MKKKLIILGCGSSIGVPSLDGNWGNCDPKNKKNLRSRCSILIDKGSNSVLIDTSPDLRSQLLRNKIKNISSVLFTHEHSDQTNCLFELRPFFFKNKKKIPVYGNSKTINVLKKRFKFCFKTANNYPAIVQANIINKSFTLGKNKEKIKFKSFSVRHGLIKNNAYIFENSAYIADCNDLSIVKIKEFKNLNYLIIDCLKYKQHPSHFNLSDSLYVHKQLKPKKTILTNLHNDMDYKTLLKKLPKIVFVVYDSLTINL